MVVSLDPSTSPCLLEPSDRPWQTCSIQQINKYSRFPALFNERKFARPFPAQKQTLSFTDDLPAELRLLVYEHLFDTPTTFELWGPDRQRPAWLADTNPLLGIWGPGPLWLDPPPPPDATSRKSRRVTRGWRAKHPQVLRLSRKVHAEAAAHLYGRTTFRFSAYNGIAAMAVFAHTIGRDHYALIRHVAVQLPHRDLSPPAWYQPGVDFCANRCIGSGRHWEYFEDALRSRGMRVPDLGVRRWHVAGQGRRRGEVIYDRAVGLAFRQLREMAGLRTLEVLIPWDYKFIETPKKDEEEWDGDRGDKERCCCQAVGWEAAAGPREVVRHLVEAHSRDPEYWALLADLRQRARAAGGHLSISLVLVYAHVRNYGRNTHDYRVSLAFHRQGRWLKAYARVMDYGFGHTSFEGDNDSPYVVDYGVNERLSTGWDQDELDPRLEPPDLD
ncbi:hypothetical protein KVR01_007500 [Diaporthe batatas]|uniref:uncharacterized protein n=1 Tax=Diaporthe batatas TaxID=748121 RepID=UPI001D05B201|nr:uncharacterized protein KVR01_007500 [Diaporthe batatas]KAG8163022.1 hypothetical protein KVR01_007500 [Diaporthe batatas]